MKGYYPHYLIEVARELRRRSTPAERILWKQLRNRRLYGLKFVRQYHIGRYIVDFFCNELQLIVELEGKVHSLPEQVTYDAGRFEALSAAGYNILRLTNEEVLNNMDDVLSKISGFENPRP